MRSVLVQFLSPNIPHQTSGEKSFSMPVCETCDGEDYEEIDGFFYCTTCQTQSQAFRVEEIEDEFGTRPSNFLQIKAKKSQTNSSKEVEDKKKDFGRPWHTYEAFQKFIKDQVKSFIKLGADPALKDAVFKIWCEYLSLTGIAFPENPEKQKVIFSGYQRQREVCPPTIENPVVPPVRSRKKHLQRFGLSMQKIKKLQEKQALSEALRDEEFYKGDNPLEEHSVSEDEEEDNMEDFVGSEDRSSVAMQDRTIRKRVQWMNMIKTLCFCYLGLRKIKCLVTASDIVRWVKQGLIPYIKATAHLPSDMKFSHSDYKVFKSRVPTVEEIYKTSERLQDFLKLTEFSVQVPTSVLISKFIVLLNLPAELHGFSQRLFLMRKEHLEEEIFDNNEDLAMMCIITTLQLMLGLNDRMEWELSKCAKQLMELPGFDHKLFCWEQWVSYINIHKLNGTYSNVLTNQFDPRSVKDIDRYVEEVKSLKMNVRKMNLHARTRYENKIEKEETISALKRPIYLLLEKVKEREKNETHPWEDEDPLSSTHSERDPLGYIMGDYDVEQAENKSDSENISFKSCSMKYITQPRSFVQELENCGLDESTIYSSYLESSDDEALEEMDIDEIDKHRDDFHTFSWNRRRKHRQAKSEMREKLSKVIDLTQPGKTKCDVKKLSEISDIVLCVQENFPLGDPLNITTNQSASLQWLIQVCSEIIQCSVEVLQSELMRFQVSMFDAEHSLQTSRRNFLQDIANH